MGHFAQRSNRVPETDVTGNGFSAWVLTGPTASGKSAVAHWIARKEGWAILSADSMLVYRGMDIGTDKPTPAERADVLYWGIDAVDPTETFSVARFLELARKALEQTPPGKLLVVGGTGLYLKALLVGLDELPPPDARIRAELEELYRREGLAALQQRLRERAPHRWAALKDRNNPRRVMRALELADAPVPKSWAQRSATQSTVVALRPDPRRLRERIAQRVDLMFQRGLLNEAANLRSQYSSLSATARKAIGYAEAFAVLEGQMSLEEARERIVRRTWQLARRQMTWLRHQLNVTWVDYTLTESVAELADRVRRAWKEYGPARLLCI